VSKLSRRWFLAGMAWIGWWFRSAVTGWSNHSHQLSDESVRPFGEEFPNLDSLAVGEWWNKPAPKGPNPPPSMNVPRDQVVAFALYTHDAGVLKLTAQLFPLKPDEPRVARLEFQHDGVWTVAAEAPVLFPGWSAHFRLENWDSSHDVPYRVRHGDAAMFEGLIRRDPREKSVIVVASMSCNSSRTTGLRPEILDNLKAQNPDLLFFAGDQTYRHTEHTAGWIEFGLQFRDVMRDRPTVTIPDDHDVGHPNLWGENGKRSTLNGHADGGYYYPVDYVNLVQRQQTWHLPDPADPAPIDRGIGVYFTRLRLGGIDFAILEDRKFKTGPAGKIPQMGPRPDHINDPSYDPSSIDLPGLQLLGDRQHQFLKSWSEDWNGADVKAVLSQTAFCGAVHCHGKPQDRLLADLDCNGWPQTGRNQALKALRAVQAVHLCGDQHLAVVVKHGIDQFGDGPYAFTSPALVNTIYGRWWHPQDEQAGPHSVENSPLPWTGDYLDGLGNKISMLAYANPADIADERQRADGYGLVRFDKPKRQITFECWPRFAQLTDGDRAQFPGWPITVRMADNDGRSPVGWLPQLEFDGAADPVVQVIDDISQEVVYTLRVTGKAFEPRTFSLTSHTVRIGRNHPDTVVLRNLTPTRERALRSLRITL
jgi:3',5'-cyclic AMP phosphodiesterase CpdA